MDTNKNNNDDVEFEERVKLLKSYIERVTNGEAMEDVQKDFKDNFSNVAAKEIAKAEQAMMAEGVPFEQIQKLCDIHSVLFHDMTDEERMERLKEEMEAHKQLTHVKEEKIENFDDKTSKKCIEYKNTQGHPINVLCEENKAIRDLLTNVDSVMDDDSSRNNLLEQLLGVKIHYNKKDELIFPLLKDKYDYPGPSDVMWAVEDEIMDDLKCLINEFDEEKLKKVLKRMEEMIYKEENILYPLCVDNFTDDEWIQIREDMDIYGPCLIEKLPVWDKTSESEVEFEVIDDKISLPGGTLSLKQLRAMLNIMPLEITIIDENDINRFFDEDENKLFKRPKMALNREVYSCHPPKVMKMVKGLIKQFKEGSRDSMHVLSQVQDQKALVNYYALRDENGEYLGTMEAVLHLNSIIENVEKGKMGPIDL